MLNKIFTKTLLRVIAVSFLLVTQGLISCDLDSGADGGTIEGTWKSSYGDYYVIDRTTLTLNDPSYGGVQYAGTIVGELASNPSLFSAEYGYIVIKITDGGRQGKTVGNYYVNHWKELTSSSVRLAGAYKDGVTADTATLADAEAEFTIDNGYFGMYGAYQKTK